MLANHGTGRLDVDVEVAGSVPERLLGEPDVSPVLCKDCSGQRVRRGRVDGLADVGEGVGRGVVVDVYAEHGAEQLGLEERVVGVLGHVDGGVDVVALAAVVLAAGDKLELGVVLGLVDDLAQLVEASLVDDGADEVAKVLWLTNLQRLCLALEAALHLVPERSGDVGAGRCGALLALVLEGAADGVDDGVLDLCAWVEEVEVLASGLAHDTGVALVSALGHTVCDLAVQAAEDSSRAGEVERCELAVCEHDLCDLYCITGHELDDIWWKTCFQEDLVEEVVGGDGGVRRLPDDNVAHERRRAREVGGNGCEVEGGDGVDEALERPVLDTVPDARRVVDGLVGICVLCVLDVEAEEVAQLGRGVDFCLVGVLSLARHGRGHDLVSVLGADQVGCLEEDGGTVCEGEVLPFRLGCEGRVNGGRDVLC